MGEPRVHALTMKEELAMWRRVAKRLDNIERESNARIEELEGERDELRTNIREGVRTLMGHRSSWVRDVASRILARMEYLAEKPK